MKANVNYIDLCAAAQDIYSKFEFKRVENEIRPTYKRFGTLYEPISSSKLKRLKRVDAPEKEIFYFGKWYMLSKTAAKILNVTPNVIVNKLKRYKIRSVTIDNLYYWSKTDVLKLQRGLLPKVDKFEFMNKLNDIKFNIVPTAKGQKFVSCDGKLEINVNLSVFGKKDIDVIDLIPTGEKFLHLSPKKESDSHFMLGNKGSVINLTKGHLLIAYPNQKGYLMLSINGKYGKLHRFIGKLWLPNLKNKPLVHHINKNRLDNRTCNLVWCTDAQHAKCHQLLKQIDKAKDKSSRAAARQNYRDYIKFLRRDNSQA